MGSVDEGKGKGRIAFLPPFPSPLHSTLLFALDPVLIPFKNPTPVLPDRPKPSYHRFCSLLSR